MSDIGEDMVILLINESVRKGYGLDVHSKESRGTIRKSKFS